MAKKADQLPDENERKTSLHIDTELWERIADLCNMTGWTNKVVFAAAILSFLESSEDSQWAALRRLSDFRKGIVPFTSHSSKKK